MCGIFSRRGPLGDYQINDFWGCLRSGGSKLFVKIRKEKCTYYAAPIGAFFVLKFVRSQGSGARFLQPPPKSLVTVKYFSNTKMTVNSR